MRLVAWVFGSPRRMAAAEAAGLPVARLLQRAGLLGRLPGPLAAWSCATRPAARAAAIVAGEVAALSARDEVLGRVRSALADVPAEETASDVPVEREYARSLGLTPEATIERFVERLADYGADVRRCAAGAEARVVSEALAANGARRVGIPHDLPAALRPAGRRAGRGLGAADARRRRPRGARRGRHHLLARDRGDRERSASPAAPATGDGR